MIDERCVWCVGRVSMGNNATSGVRQVYVNRESSLDSLDRSLALVRWAFSLVVIVTLHKTQDGKKASTRVALRSQSFLKIQEPFVHSIVIMEFLKDLSIDKVRNLAEDA